MVLRHLLAVAMIIRLPAVPARSHPAGRPAFGLIRPPITA